MLEFVNLAKTLKTKGLKLLHNIKTHWISMVNLWKRVLGECKSLIVKMHTYAPKNKLVWKNQDLLCDLELIFHLPCILSMLESGACTH